MIDEPAFPKPGPVNHAVNSIDVQWRASGTAQTLSDPSKHFSIQGRSAEIAADFDVSQPWLGFSSKWSATPVTYAFLGDEVNGYFFDTPTADQVVMPMPVGAPDTGGGSAAANDNLGLYMAGGCRTARCSGGRFRRRRPTSQRLASRVEGRPRLKGCVRADARSRPEAWRSRRKYNLWLGRHKAGRPTWEP